jgi:hypothetical protein
LTHARHAAGIGDRVRRPHVEVCLERQLQLVPQSDVQRQVRRDTEGILHEQPDLVLVRPSIRRAVDDILIAHRVQAHLGRDRRDAPGEQGIEKLRICQARVRGSGKSRRREQRIGRIAGHDAEGERRHRLLVPPPALDICQLSSKLQAMPSALPADLVGQAPEGNRC